MRTSSNTALAFALGAGLIAGTTRAQSGPAPDKQECGDAYEKAQEQRASGALLSARRELSVCAAATCPAFIRDDCTSWENEIDQQLPSVMFQIRAQGQIVSTVAIKKDGAPFGDYAPEQLIPIDPGEYIFDFEAPGYQDATRHVTLKLGSKKRVISVDLLPLAVAPEAVSVAPLALPPSAARAAPALPTQPTQPTPSPRPAAQGVALAPWLLGGLGVAGITGFAVFGLSGRSQEAALRRDCLPHCSERELGALHAKFLIADVSLGVGLASLAVSSYWFLSSSTSNAAESASAVRLPVKLNVARTAVSANWVGVF